MTLTSEDTAGVRRGRMDTLARLADFYMSSFTVAELVSFEVLRDKRTLDWQEIDALDLVIKVALMRAMTGRRVA